MINPPITQIGVSAFKIHCLKLIDEVHQTHVPLQITKHGRPVAVLTPFTEENLSFCGHMAGSVTIHGDIMAPIDVEWKENA